MAIPAPVLIFAYGNISRGDDGLGPLLLEAIEAQIDPQQVELLCDFQLQVEHALDLKNRHLVLFVDAAVNLTTPYRLSAVQAQQDLSYTSHAMSPESIVFVAQQTLKQEIPPVYLLSIQGKSFELGEGLSPTAQKNLTQAELLVHNLIRHASTDYWNSQIE